MRALAAADEEETAEQRHLVESRRTRATELADEVTRIRGGADRGSAGAAATIGRLESDLDDARVASRVERTRIDDIRGELGTARADFAASRTQTVAVRERGEELRAELAEVRRCPTSTIGRDARWHDTATPHLTRGGLPVVDPEGAADERRRCGTGGFAARR
ncbi:hypothetical protein SAMN04490239_1639 [Rhodococcus koreensis]|uniref:Uncharacterized protein n=1 Tax=Rhodococcus koreensis TaxID=99653 RepID=A0A1H4M588_9NOCA|nr:hypothetical protein SAMN04490239_1639 [Rhodococcus koreensis]